MSRLVRLIVFRFMQAQEVLCGLPLGLAHHAACFKSDCSADARPLLTLLLLQLITPHHKVLYSSEACCWTNLSLK